MLNKRSVVIEDIYADERIPADAYRPTFVKSLAMVPIRTIDPIGAIGNYWATHHTPTEDEVKLLQALADITAVTLENVKVYNELEERVKERTAQLEAINNDLEAFSYSVSHDLRAPLRAIDGYMHILCENYEDKFDEENNMLASKVRRNVKEMGILIDDLLGFFRTGKKELSKHATPMKAMVNEIWRRFKEHEKNRDIEFTINGLPEIQADSSLMKQVWINLIANAVKYTKYKSEAHIEVDFLEKEDSIVYFIKDNGVGFDMKYYNKLFGIFNRLHSADKFDGTGIGLAIVERIISRHGGKVWAEGKPDEGAVFYFELPKLSADGAHYPELEMHGTENLQASDERNSIRSEIHITGSGINSSLQSAGSHS
jgi:light-regulated signal transduction histidine kinase (bacteriophytochrome)